MASRTPRAATGWWKLSRMDGQSRPRTEPGRATLRYARQAREKGGTAGTSFESLSPRPHARRARQRRRAGEGSLCRRSGQHAMTGPTSARARLPGHLSSSTFCCLLNIRPYGVCRWHVLVHPEPVDLDPAHPDGNAASPTSVGPHPKTVPVMPGAGSRRWSGGLLGWAVGVEGASVGCGGGGGAVGVAGDVPAPPVYRDLVVEPAVQAEVAQAGGAALGPRDQVVDLADGGGLPAARGIGSAGRGG